MTTSNTSTADFIDKFWKIPLPPTRFNRWGERKYITASDETYTTIQAQLIGKNVDRRAADLFLAAKLTDSCGVEFIFISNLAKQNYFEPIKRPILTVPASQGIGSEGAEHAGSDDMVEHYLNLSHLTPSGVTMKFTSSNQQSFRASFSLWK